MIYLGGVFGFTMSISWDMVEHCRKNPEYHDVPWYKWLLSFLAAFTFCLGWPYHIVDRILKDRQVDGHN